MYLSWGDLRGSPTVRTPANVRVQQIKILSWPGFPKTSARPKIRRHQSWPPADLSVPRYFYVYSRERAFDCDATTHVRLTTSLREDQLAGLETADRIYPTNGS